MSDELSSQDRTYLVACPACCSLPNQKCRDLGVGSDALNLHHPERVEAAIKLLAVEREARASGDSVNHPAYYNAHPVGIECIEVVEHFTFNIGNAVKYVWRAGLKGGEESRVEDLKKSVWYLNREIQRLEKGK